MSDALASADPFDLPDWLGTEEVTWTATAGLRAGASVSGELTAAAHPSVACDLLAVDDAYPAPVAADAIRLLAHQAWRNGEVHVAERAGRLTLLVPGTSFDADRVLDALGRLARAVGADPGRYAVLLRLGAPRRPAAD